MKANYKGLIIQPHGVYLSGCTIFVLLCFSLLSYSQGDSWQQKQSLGLATPSRYQAVSFSIGGKGYTGTGITGGKQNDFWEYDPIANVWTQKANVPGGPRSSATGFSTANKGYIGLGDNLSDVSYYKDFYEYDPATNIWTRKADFGGGSRSGATGFSIGSKGYVGTGSTRGGVPWYSDSSTNDFWEFDPATNVWTQKANFAGSVRISASGFSIGEKGYIGLGRNANTIGASLYNDFWEYDPAADTWFKKANFGGEARYGATCFSIGNKGFLGTGYENQARSKKDFWEYDPATDMWNQKANFGGDPREQAIGFCIGNKGYIGTGYRSNDEYTFGPKNDFWEYDPAMNAWVQKTGLDGARMNAVGFSVDGKGYVGTGYDGSPKKDFYQYDPATDQWLRKADFAGGERQQATGFGINGTGYLGQGFARGRSTFVNDFWKYNPDSDTWQQGSAPYSLARAGATLFEIGGKIFFGLGYYYATSLHDFWAFDPSTGAWTQITDWIDMNSSGGFSFGGKAYVLASYLWQYDSVVHTWVKKHEKPANAEIIGFSFNIAGKGYAFTNNYELWEYDPAKDVWTQRKAFPSQGRSGSTLFTIGDRAYIGFGSINNVLQNDFWEYTPPSENSITTNLATTTICSGVIAAISYTAKGTFGASNVFTAQLSDASGDFSQPKALATDTSITSGVINVTIPDSLSTGQAYRIRVVSSSPAITGSDNGVDLIINPAPVARAQNLKVYLNERGIAILRPKAIDSGSTGSCGALNFSLDENKFDCGKLGFNKVTLTVVDQNGNMATDTAIVTVLDTLQPRIWGAYAIPTTIWPPNHKMKEVTILYWTNDNCSVLSKSLSVTSNELQSATIPDWLIPDDHHVLLKAEMNESRNKKRIYYITITVKDLSGNLTTEVVKVIVSPDHDENLWAPGNIKGLIVSTLSNPSREYFTLIFRSKNNQPIYMRVTNVFGQLIVARNNIPPNGTLQIGGDYKPGTYYVLVVQGKERVTLRLVKQ